MTSRERRKRREKRERVAENARQLTAIECQPPVFIGLSYEGDVYDQPASYPSVFWDNRGSYAKPVLLVEENYDQPVSVVFTVEELSLAEMKATKAKSLLKLDLELGRLDVKLNRALWQLAEAMADSSVTRANDEISELEGYDEPVYVQRPEDFNLPYPTRKENFESWVKRWAATPPDPLR